MAVDQRRPPPLNNGRRTLRRSTAQTTLPDPRSGLRTPQGSSRAREAPLWRLSESQAGSVATSANASLHLQLDQPVELDRVLHRQLFGDRLDEAVDDHLRGLLLVEPAALQVEELLVADFGDRRLVADVGVVLVDADRRVGVRARVLVEEQRVADD